MTQSTRIHELEAENAALREGRGEPTFQARVHDWIVACFGEEIGADTVERNHRFIEEALELVQANGCTQSEAHQLVYYVFSRPVGDPHQEVGGVMNTLAALCTASGLDMRAAGEDELARVWTKVEKIRAKQAAKPKHSPLPQEVSALSPAPVSVEDVMTDAEFASRCDSMLIFAGHSENYSLRVKAAQIIARHLPAAPSKTERG